MNTLTLAMVFVLLTPLYVSWLFALLLLAAIPPLIGIFLVGIPLWIKLHSNSRIVEGEAEELKEHGIADLRRLVRARAESTPRGNSLSICACVGGKGSQRSAIVHIRSGTSSWSYWKHDATEAGAITRLKGSLAAKRTLRIPSVACAHPCAIANRCPNRTPSKDFQEVFRVAVPA